MVKKVNTEMKQIKTNGKRGMNGQCICPSFLDDREHKEPKINGETAQEQYTFLLLRLPNYLLGLNEF